MTITDNQRAWRKQTKEDTKKIESILHPDLFINGIEICHEHLRNGKIRFTAWIKDIPIKNGKQVVVSRHDVLTRSDFYLLYKRDLEWLVI